MPLGRETLPEPFVAEPLSMPARVTRADGSPSVVPRRAAAVELYEDGDAL